MTLDLHDLPAHIAEELRWLERCGARYLVAYHPARPRGIIRICHPKHWQGRAWNAFGADCEERGRQQPSIADVSADVPDVYRRVLACDNPFMPDWFGFLRLALRLSDLRLVVLETETGIAGPGYVDVTDDAGAPRLCDIRDAPRMCGVTQEWIQQNYAPPTTFMWTNPSMIPRN